MSKLKDPKDWGKTLDPFEKVIEKKVKTYAKTLGVHSRKWKSPAQRNVPDTLFFFPYEVLLAIEFKRKGKKARPAQMEEMGHLDTRGFSVYVIDNIADGKKLIDEYHKKAMQKGFHEQFEDE